jgi:hypothetical protein
MRLAPNADDAKSFRISSCAPDGRLHGAFRVNQTKLIKAPHGWERHRRAGCKTGAPFRRARCKPAAAPAAIVFDKPIAA